jgi:hypothetical protein
MATKPILENGQCVEVVSQAGPLVRYGYGFAWGNNADPNVQYQRWFFTIKMDELPKKFPPRNRVVWRKAALAPWKDIHAEQDFYNVVGSIFQPLNNVYVKVNCSLHATLPDPVPAFPANPTPDPGGSSQVDVSITRLKQVGMAAANGYVNASAPSGGYTQEMWILTPGYKWPTETNSQGNDLGRLDKSEMRSLMTATTWVAGSTLVLATCAYYDQTFPENIVP